MYGPSCSSSWSWSWRAPHAVPLTSSERNNKSSDSLSPVLKGAELLLCDARHVAASQVTPLSPCREDSLPEVESASVREKDSFAELQPERLSDVICDQDCLSDILIMSSGACETCRGSCTGSTSRKKPCLKPLGIMTLR